MNELVEIGNKDGHGTVLKERNKAIPQTQSERGNSADSADTHLLISYLNPNEEKKPLKHDKRASNSTLKQKGLFPSKSRLEKLQGFTKKLMILMVILFCINCCYHWSARKKEVAQNQFINQMNRNDVSNDVNEDTGNQQFALHQFAYVWYATNAQYFCSAMVSMENLLRTNPHSNIDFVFIIPEHKSTIISNRALQRIEELNAIRNGSITIKEIAIPYKPSFDHYRDCMLKLTAFTLYEYQRVIITDADALINRNLDHLFFLPETIVAAPHAQWLEGKNKPMFVTSLLMVIQPDEKAWTRIVNHFEQKTTEKDMDIINHEFRMELLTLPSTYAALDVALWTDKDALAWYGKTAKDAIQDLYVIHFTGSKPWQVSMNPRPEWAQEKPEYFGLFQSWHESEAKVC